MPNPLPSKMMLELDGQELELVIQSLTMEMKRSEQQRKYYKARQLKLIINRYRNRKYSFHGQWNSYLLT